MHLMLMAHTMQIKRPDLVQRVFDLKGSTVDRKARLTKQTNNLKTLKDENFLYLNRRAKEDLVIMFESDRAFVKETLRKDSHFLKDLNIMDYSLLLCVQKRDQSEHPHNEVVNGSDVDSSTDLLLGQHLSSPNRHAKLTFGSKNQRSKGGSSSDKVCGNDYNNASRH